MVCQILSILGERVEKCELYNFPVSWSIIGTGEGNIIEWEEKGQTKQESWIISLLIGVGFVHDRFIGSQQMFVK